MNAITKYRKLFLNVSLKYSALDGSYNFNCKIKYALIRMDFKIQILDGNDAFLFPTALPHRLKKKQINGLGINSVLQHYISLHIYFNYIPITKLDDLNNGVTYNAVYKQQGSAKLYGLIFMGPRAPGINIKRNTTRQVFTFMTLVHT